MYCYNCGEQIDDKAVVCVHCGVAVGELKRSYSDSAEDTSNAPKNMPQCDNPLAIAGFIVSLVGVLFFILMFFFAWIAMSILSLLCGVIAITLSDVGLNNVRNKNAKYRGHATAGLTIGIVVLCITLIVFLSMVIIAGSVMNF